MMIRTKTFSAPSVNIKEVLRYAGGGESELVSECVKEAEPVLSYKVCFASVDINLYDGLVDFGFTRVESRNLSKNLSGCSKAVIFAATVGVGIDRLIGKYNSGKYPREEGNSLHLGVMTDLNYLHII